MVNHNQWVAIKCAFHNIIIENKPFFSESIDLPLDIKHMVMLRSYTRLVQSTSEILRNNCHQTQQYRSVLFGLYYCAHSKRAHLCLVLSATTSPFIVRYLFRVAFSLFANKRNSIVYVCVCVRCFLSHIGHSNSEQVHHWNIQYKVQRISNYPRTVL